MTLDVLYTIRFISVAAVCFGSIGMALSVKDPAKALVWAVVSVALAVVLVASVLDEGGGNSA